ncbi:RNA polymerase sigma factor [Streptomyces sp. NPDC093094]|uniref:RNA polymerase sigma factor n=1 Tax=Streptomyces sp. NPDC093094 TaxID=3366026 RepID=UPI00382307C5
MTTDDCELVARYCAGEYEAGRRLLDRHWHALIKVALPRLGGNWHDAEEAVVDAFVALAAYRGDEPILSAGAWLRKVVRRKAVDRIRAGKPDSGGQVEESLPASDEGIEQVDEQRAFICLLQALDVTERRIMAAAVDDRTMGGAAREQARALGMELHRDYYPASRRARQQAREARILLHMLREAEPCQGLLQACDVTPGQEGPRLTPEGRAAGTAHIEECASCRTEREKVKDRHWVPGVVIAPSPELYDRIRNICDATAMRTEAGTARKPRRPRTPDSPQDLADGGELRPALRGETAGAAVRHPHRRSRRRVGTVLTACLAAVVSASALAARSGANVSLPDISSIPGVRTITGSEATPQGPASDGGSSASTGGSNHGSAAHDDTGGDSTGTGTGTGNTVEGVESDASDGRSTKSTKTGEKKDGSTESDENDDDVTHTDDRGTTTDEDEDETTATDDDETTTHDDTSAQDLVGPTVGLAGISTEAVGQEVVDHNGVLMQTCGPTGTPTTFSVWAAVSDPSGIGNVQLTVQHPTDAPFTVDGVADGGTFRFDVPAHRTGPRFLETQQLQLSVTATDTQNNRTDTVLRSLALYECGEPG